MTEFEQFMVNALNNIQERLSVIEANTTKKKRVVKKEPLIEDGKQIIEREFKEILDYWNMKFQKSLKYSKCHRAPIVDRIKEGFQVEDFKQVICNKMNDPYFNDHPQFFMPKTLFGTKMDVYLNGGVIKPESSLLDDELFSGEIEEGL